MHITELYNPHKVPENWFERYAEQTMFDGCCRGYEGFEAESGSGRRTRIRSCVSTRTRSCAWSSRPTGERGIRLPGEAAAGRAVGADRDRAGRETTTITARTRG